VGDARSDGSQERHRDNPHRHVIAVRDPEGAKYSGEKLKEAAQAAEPPAKTAWGNARDGAVGFGQSVKGFFTKLFSN
jgi:hypothetical protein